MNRSSNNRWQVGVALSAVLLLAAWAAPVLACENGRTAAGDNFVPQLQKSSELIGLSVRNAKGDSLGKIEDLVLNSEQNCISYAVLAEKAGFLDLGSKLLVVPWSALQIEPGWKYVVLDVNRDALKMAKGIDPKHWPDMADPNFVSDVNNLVARGRHVGGVVSMAPTTQPEGFWMRKVSRLVGQDVRNDSGLVLGRISNVMIDLCEGRTVYGVLALGNASIIRGGLCLVPWSALEIGSERAVVRLDVPLKTIETLAFKPGQWPNLSDRSYATRVYEQFSREPYWEVFGYVPQRGQPMGPAAAWLADSDYNRKFDVAGVVEFEGTVESVSTFEPVQDAFEGLVLTVSTDQGVKTVHVGPVGYLEKENVSFDNGDRVKISGSQVAIDGKEVILAIRITAGDKALTCRDKDGAPLWTLDDLERDLRGGTGMEK